MGQEQCKNGARITYLTNVSEQKRGDQQGKGECKRRTRDILDVRVFLSKDERNNGKENPTTYQKTELQLIIAECQELHLIGEPLPAGWQSNVSLISLHHIILQSYQVLIYHVGLTSEK